MLRNTAPCTAELSQHPMLGACNSKSSCPERGKGNGKDLVGQFAWVGMHDLIAPSSIPGKKRRSNPLLLVFLGAEHDLVLK